MEGKIAFEEHMAIEETLQETKSFAGVTGAVFLVRRQ